MSDHNMFLIVFVLVVLPLPYVTGHGIGHNSSCSRDQNDCPCGQQCVDANGNELCDSKYHCQCREGCRIYDKFIAPEESKDIYGSTCDCYFPLFFGGIPSCTGNWRNIPEGTKSYPANPNCN